MRERTLIGKSEIANNQMRTKGPFTLCHLRLRFITDCIRRMDENYAFAGICLLTGGTQSASHNTSTGPMPFLGGYPWSGENGGTPTRSGWGIPLARTGMGYPPPARSIWGIPSQVRSGWSTPPQLRQDKPWSVYVAVSTPLSIYRRRSFLFLLKTDCIGLVTLSQSHSVSTSIETCSNKKYSRNPTV